MLIYLYEASVPVSILRKYLIFRGKFRRTERSGELQVWSHGPVNEIQNLEDAFSLRHQCPRCPRGFLHVENYLCHLKMHKLFLCLQCGKTFTQKKNLNRHIRGHMGIRAFQCTVCLKTFTAKSTLQDHLNIHSGDRPYKCHCCDMDFKHKSALEKHLTSLHGRSSGEKLPRHDLERQNLL